MTKTPKKRAPRTIAAITTSAVNSEKTCFSHVSGKPSGCAASHNACCASTPATMSIMCDGGSGQSGAPSSPTIFS